MEMKISTGGGCNPCNKRIVENKVQDAQEKTDQKYKQISELRAFHHPVINFKGRGGKELERLPVEAKEAMDCIETEFGIPSGPYGFERKPFYGTLKEYIAACFQDDEAKVYRTETLHATSKDSAESILKEGFDINKCSRNLGGPGIYFARDVVRIKQVGNGGEILGVSVEGNCRNINPRYYSGIEENEVLLEKTEEILKKSGSKLDARKAVEKYVLEVLNNDFGLDMLRSSDLVALNSKCIKGVGRSSLSDVQISGSGYDAYIVTKPPQETTKNSYYGGNSTQGEMEDRSHVCDDIRFWNY